MYGEDDAVPMDLTLQQWYGNWLAKHEGTNLIYANTKEPQLHQVHFVRDTLAFLMWSDKEYEDLPEATYYDSDYYNGGGNRTVKDLVRVISEHRSKSVRLPVFSISRPDHGLRLVMRYNFHDWNVSVISERPVDMNVAGYGGKFSPEEKEKFKGGFTPGRYWGNLFFQGFPRDLQFGPHELDQRKFSLAPYNDYELYAFVRELAHKMIRRP